MLAHCRPTVSVYEKATQVPALGKPGGVIRSVRFVITLCRELDFTREDTSAERYELTADILRRDGIIERFYFHNIFLSEIDGNGNWEFEVEVTQEQREKLLQE